MAADPVELGKFADLVQVDAAALARSALAKRSPGHCVLFGEWLSTGMLDILRRRSVLTA